MNADLQEKFWREATGAEVYIINRAQFQVNNDKNPYELWKGRSASVKDFRIFGSKFCMKINYDSLGKIDSRVDKGIFLGYSLRSNAYKCYDIRLWKIVKRIDVNIDEAPLKKEVVHTNEEDPIFVD